MLLKHVGCCGRGLMARRMLRDARKAASLIAAAWRGRVARRHVRQLRQETAATRIAAAWRSYTARKAFKTYRVVATSLHTSAQLLLHDAPLLNQCLPSLQCEVCLIARW
jgi:Cdc6-like AAA superfamily ATPase